MNNVNYAYSLEKNNDTYLIPIGKVIQVDGELENLIVRNEIKGCPLKCGDLILEVEGNYVVGANIAGFLKVADAMMAQGLV